MGGAYVLINDTDGKIIKAYDGEIFIIGKVKKPLIGEIRLYSLFYWPLSLLPFKLRALLAARTTGSLGYAF